MDLHQNARLSFRSREALANKIIFEQLTLKAAAAAFNVSRKTAAKWLSRYRTLGLHGLRDASSRPRRSPRRTSSALTDQVIALRRQLRPAYQIAQATGLSPATVSRILRRAHLNRWRHLHPAPPVVRYEHPAPGDLLHLDIKGMTRYQQVSIRGDGRRRGRPQFAGWQALHVAIDDHSRLAFSRMLPNQQSQTAIAFLRAAVAFYAQHGIVIRRLLTDNGSCYRSHPFRAACLQLGLQHRFTRPYTPRTNGKAERFIQTALREWAYVRHYPNSEEGAGPTFLPFPNCGCPTLVAFFATGWANPTVYNPAEFASNPIRYQNQCCLHFITFSCYRQMKLLNDANACDLFERELERVRLW